MQQASDQLKEKIATVLVLALQEIDVPFVMETDASSAAIGAVLAWKGKD